MSTTLMYDYIFHPNKHSPHFFNNQKPPDYLHISKLWWSILS